MALADLIDAHRGAFEYDWRTRFNQERGLSIVGTHRMSWGEAYRLTEILAADPGARVASALAGWEHPASRDLMALMDLFDSSEAARAGRKAKPYPRPWVKRKTRFGSGFPLDELKAKLAAHRAAVDADPTLDAPSTESAEPPERR